MPSADELITKEFLIEQGFVGFGEALAWMYTNGTLTVSGIHPTTPANGLWMTDRRTIQIKTKDDLLAFIRIYRVN